MSTSTRLIQLSVIGAMQRSNPALTQLWLQWTGIRYLDLASFDTVRPDEPGPSGTQITLAPKLDAREGWDALCDSLGIGADAQERRTMPIRLDAKHTGHSAFWQHMKERELTVVDGPLEWWWRLLVLRQRGIRRASRLLATRVFGDDPFCRAAILSFDNPSLAKEGRRALDICTSYKSPQAVVLSVPVSKGSKREALAFSLSDAKLRAHLTSSVIDLATTRLA